MLKSKIFFATACTLLAMLGCSARKSGDEITKLSSDKTHAHALLATKLLGGKCTGSLSPELQAVALAGGSLVGTLEGMTVISFESESAAKSAAGKENACIKLGSYVHKLDTKGRVSYMAEGVFDPAPCLGGCPGLKFVSDGDVLWVSEDDVLKHVSDLQDVVKENVRFNLSGWIEIIPNNGEDAESNIVEQMRVKTMRKL